MEFKFKSGDVVKHFKYETLTEEEKKAKKYLYKIVFTNCMHTETEETMVVYKAMYAPYTVFTRPKDMFNGLVDKEKYPNIKQTYRFEKFTK